MGQHATFELLRCVTYARFTPRALGYSHAALVRQIPSSSCEWWDEVAGEWTSTLSGSVEGATLEQVGGNYEIAHNITVAILSGEHYQINLDQVLPLKLLKVVKCLYIEDCQKEALTLFQELI